MLYFNHINNINNINNIDSINMTVVKIKVKAKTKITNWIVIV